MIIDKEDYNSDIVDTINNTFEEYKLELIYPIIKTILSI